MAQVVIPPDLKPIWVYCHRAVMEEVRKPCQGRVTSRTYRQRIAEGVLQAIDQIAYKRGDRKSVV